MKKILVTGAGSGLGEELAKCYAKGGNHVILVGRTIDKLKRVAGLIEESGASAECIECDISDADSVKRLSEKVISEHGSIDYLINNAGVGFFGGLEKLSMRELNMMMDINVKGTIMMTQSLFSKVNERILNIISTAGLRGKPNEAAYVASKFAVRGFTESLQKELADSSLKVTAVYMGGMDTPFWTGSTHVADTSRFKSAAEVAQTIKENDDGRAEIMVDR